MINTAVSAQNNDRHWIRVGKTWHEVSERNYRTAAKKAGIELPNGSSLGAGEFSGKNFKHPKGLEVKGKITSKHFPYAEYKNDPEFLLALMNSDLVSHDFE